MKTIRNLFGSAAGTLRQALLTVALLAAALGVAMPAAAALQSVAVTAQSGPLQAGTAGSVTYTVTITRNNGAPTNTSPSISGLPSGASASFGTQSSWSPATGTGTRTVPLTITTTAAVGSGTFTFTVRANVAGGPIGNATLVVTGLTQTITWGSAPSIRAGSSGTLSATASSGLPVSFSSTTPSLCSVSGNQVSGIAVGNCVVAANQSGNASYTPAPQVTQGISVAQGTQSITFGALGNKFNTSADFTLSATASSGLPVGFAVTGGSAVCSVSGNTVSLSGSIGTCQITASQQGSANYLAALDVVRSFDVTAYTGNSLHAVSNNVVIAGQSVKTLAYTPDGSAATHPGGPTIIVNEGETVEIALVNHLNENTALLIPGIEMIPDTTGAAPGELKLYTFTAARPGTYVYEAGLLANAEHQVAMGLYGALIVRPATQGQAYQDAASAYDAEALLVLSEVDPALNNNADPASFDMRQFNPKYFLINGKAYPDTDPIAAAGGDKVLLRYVNAGARHHSMSLLGLRQNFIARDASLLPTLTHNVVAETLAPGQTADAIAAIPAGATVGSKFALYEAGLISLRNSNQANFGGMMTFVNVGTGTSSGGDTQGPAVSSVALAGVGLTATVSDVASGNGNIAAAEYWIDSGTHLPMSGTFGTPTVTVSATLASLLPGTHTVYVRGQDAAGNWGSPGFTSYNSDVAGPLTSGLTLTPNPSSAGTSGQVALHATADDTATGGSHITAAEYFVGAAGTNGTGTAMTVSADAVIASIDAVVAVTEGAVFNVHSRDAAGNWGGYVSIVAHVVANGPSTTILSVTPNPNNGAKPLDSTNLVVRVAANMTSSGSSVAGAEGFIDSTPATTVRGFPFVPQDGRFNSGAEVGTADIPLSTIATLSAGVHSINVRALDAAGNWGSFAAGSLTIDKTPPSVSSIARTAASPTSATVLTFNVTFSESVSGLSATNFSLVGTLTGGTIAGVTGSGTSWQVVVNTNGRDGTLGLNLVNSTGLADLAGNAIATGLPFTGEVYTVLSPPLYFSTVGSSTVPGVGGTADDADIYYWNGTAFSRALVASGTASLGLPVNANVDGFVRVDASHFYMSFNGQVAVPGLGTVEDEDVVYYNNGTWSLWFDGSAFGLGGTTNTTSFDLDAISIVGGTLYFSLDNSNVPPGAGGAGDDADIYRWNGGSSYSRVVDASGAGSLGLSNNANVDGFKWVDATHFYMSFSTDTALPGLGAVQDEDVVYYNNGTWSVYFDGTSKGLTNNNLDIDAFDIP